MLFKVLRRYSLAFPREFHDSRAPGRSKCIFERFSSRSTAAVNGFNRRGRTSNALLACAIQSAACSGRFSVEAGEKGDAWRISGQMVHETALLGTRTQVFPVETGEINWLVHSARIAEKEK